MFNTWKLERSCHDEDVVFVTVEVKVCVYLLFKFFIFQIFFFDQLTALICLCLSFEIRQMREHIAMSGIFCHQGNTIMNWKDCINFTAGKLIQLLQPTLKNCKLCKVK